MVYGFRYSCGSKEEWKRIVKENNHVFYIGFDNNSRLSIFVNGTIISAIKAVSDLSVTDLVGHTVKVIGSPNYKETDNTISNLVIKVID